MKLSQKFKKLISATAAAALFVTSFPAFYHYEDAAAADSVSIDTKITYQTIKGFGGINLPEWAGSDMTSQQVKMNLQLALISSYLRRKLKLFDITFNNWLIFLSIYNGHCLFIIKCNNY